MRLLLLTATADHPYFHMVADDRVAALSAPLQRAGITAETLPWFGGADPEAAGFEPGAGFDAVCPLLAWGYHLRADAWAALLDRLEAAGARMVNPIPLLRWNTAKTYLADLAAVGVAVVPTHYVEAMSLAARDQALAAFGVEAVVAKPQISAGSQETVVLRAESSLEDAPRGAALIQPFLPAVADEGEYSLFFFGGVFSHAVVKTAAPGDFRVQPQFGGAERAVTAGAEAMDLAQAVLAAAPAHLGAAAYARIDLIRGLDGRLALMELELIEPDLFLRRAPDGGAAFARAMAAALRG